METQKKLSLAQELLERITKMEFSNNELELSTFKNEGEVILSKIVGEKSNHITKFRNVMFSALIYDPHATPNAISYEKSQAFNRGKNTMISILKGVIKDIELEVLDTPSNSSHKISSSVNRNKVFIVHGHDDSLKTEVALFVSSLGLKPYILHDLPSKGKTIIEKIEHYSEDITFAIILYTPCDSGKSKLAPDYRDRARQNVIFEHGYFVAKLGRENVVALYKGDDIELPSDINGVLYTNYYKDWKFELVKELKANGYEISL